MHVIQTHKIFYFFPVQCTLHSLWMFAVSIRYSFIIFSLLNNLSFGGNDFSCRFSQIINLFLKKQIFFQDLSHKNDIDLGSGNLDIWYSNNIALFSHVKLSNIKVFFFLTFTYSRQNLQSSSIFHFIYHSLFTIHSLFTTFICFTPFKAIILTLFTFFTILSYNAYNSYGKHCMWNYLQENHLQVPISFQLYAHCWYKTVCSNLCLRLF